MHSSRFIIGIDLGTTNSAVTCIDTEKDPGSIRPFRIRQLVAPGEVAECDLLPSFCYIPDVRFLPEGTLRLPWNDSQDHAVGVFARQDGAAVPSRFVASAKSWLCHAGVDRRGRILPWVEGAGSHARSPLEITRHYLEHIRSDWDDRFGSVFDREGNPCRFSEQQVVVTVPASFDETARELTLEAAKEAGYGDIALLEEPLAAFYSYLHFHADSWETTIGPAETILVIDIGGGTTDFTIIETDTNRVLRRTATGDHLLLGGDNMDAALAKSIESSWKAHLSPSEWSALCQQTRVAKENLLGGTSEQTDVVLLSKGSSLIAGMRRASLSYESVETTLLDGFFPEIRVDSPSPTKKRGIQTMGLPFEPDPAITRHLLDFLRRAAAVCGCEAPLCPNKILFNGGALVPDRIRNRILDVVRSWFPGEKGSRIDILPNGQFQEAVAYGAAYFGRTRRGQGVKVRSGTARSYFIEVQEGEDRAFLCVMPRGIDEQVRIEMPRQFLLEANCKAEFPLYSSSTRLGDRAGDKISSSAELQPVSRLIGVIRFGKHEKRSIAATISAELTVTGVLHLRIDSATTRHRWPLKFDVRLIRDEANLKTSEGGKAEVSRQLLDADLIREGCGIILEAFQSEPRILSGLVKKLEAVFGLERSEWPLPMLRELGDTLLDIPRKNLGTAARESRWLNLCGFVLRPGCGDPADDLRLRRAWQLWHSGPIHPNDQQAASEWWVFWRRIVPGLKTGQQRQIGQKLLKLLCPKGEYTAKCKTGEQSLMEMWRCLGSLELLSPSEKIEIGSILLERGQKLLPHELWVIARIGARRLFRAPANHIVSPEIVAEWLETLLKLARGRSDSGVLFPLYRIAALCGDRTLDLDPEVRNRVRLHLESNGAHTHWIEHLEKTADDTAEEQAGVLGDALPLGLQLVE